MLDHTSKDVPKMLSLTKDMERMQRRSGAGNNKKHPAFHSWMCVTRVTIICNAVSWHPAPRSIPFSAQRICNYPTTVLAVSDRALRDCTISNNYCEFLGVMIAS